MSTQHALRTGHEPTLVGEFLIVALGPELAQLIRFAHFLLRLWQAVCRLVVGPGMQPADRAESGADDLYVTELRDIGAQLAADRTPALLCGDSIWPLTDIDIDRAFRAGVS